MGTLSPSAGGFGAMRGPDIHIAAPSLQLCFYRINIVRQDTTSERRGRSFGSVSNDYNRFRPGPPDEAVEWLLPAGASRVLEIGAGTGALTRKLVRRVDQVLAVEPDGRMRAVLQADTPEAEVVAGQAEDIPADAASFDAVVAASAWHWVDEERALPEVARVLRPGGRLALVWSGPDRSIDWMQAVWAGGRTLSHEQRRAMDSHRSERHTVNLEADSPFDEPERHVIRWTQRMTKDELVGLAGTYSAIITMGQTARLEYLDSIARYLANEEQFIGLDVIDVPMGCLCWRASLR
jgi:SAM-dependent methyltransferase